MNAPMDKTGRLRGSASCSGSMLQMQQTPNMPQQKPVFTVLENSAIADASAAQFPITRIKAESLKSAFSLLSDDLLCEIVSNSPPSTASPTTLVPYAKVNIPNSVLSHDAPLAQLRQTAVRRDTKVAQFKLRKVKLCKVVDRKYKWLRPNALKAPDYIVGYCVETLECGAVLTIPPIEGEHLTAARRYCHECSRSYVEAIEGRKPQDKVNGAKKRKMAGNSAWPLVFAAVILTGWAIWFHYHRAISYTYTAPETSFRVIEKVDSYTFIMQKVERGVPQAAVKLRFCKDYTPPFEGGMTLTWFSYEDRGSCVSIAPANRGYVILRGPDHWPIIPNNCVNPAADKPIVCDGLPNFDGGINVRSK